MSKNVTIRDVATLADVSVGTVSNHLTGKKRVSSDAAQRIDLAVKKLRFVPNSAVRIVRGGRAPAIGLVVPDPANPFYVEVARGIDEAASSAGMLLITCGTKQLLERERSYVRMLSEMRVQGLLVTPIGAEDDHILAFCDAGGAALLLDEPQHHARMRSVGVDDRLGGMLAVKYLLEQGHTDILFVGGPGGGARVEERYRGGSDAIAAANAPVTFRRIDAPGETARDQASVGDAIAEMVPRPTGVFCANDLIALAILGQLQRRGVGVPQDVALIGFDDIEAASLSNVPLTTVRQPQYELGLRAAEILLAGTSHQAEPADLWFEPELVIRESTAGPGSVAAGR